MKICLVASRGGHVEELRFAKELNSTAFLITEESTNAAAICDKVYYVEHINRKEPNAIWKIFKLFFRAAAILNQEQPDCFISTGALISIPILLLGKLRGKKVVFIETLARVESPSISGRIAYCFADIFIVYWKTLLEFYPKAHYIDLFSEDPA